MSIIERYLPLQVKRGVFKQGTKYQGKGRWIDSHLVRWYEDTMGPIGGWVEVLDVNGDPLTSVGFPRAGYGWRDNVIQAWLAIGSFCDLWLYGDHVVTSIKPSDLVCGNQDGAYIVGGYGTGPYGAGGYGTGVSGGSSTLTPADTWTLDNYGENLVACYTADGRILMADTSGSPAAQVANSPTGCVAVVVTPEHFLVALGGTSEGGGPADPRRVRWADIDDPTYWTIDSTHSAGEAFLGTRGRLLSGARTRRQTILFSDVDAYAMTFIGGDAVFAFEQIGDHCGIIGPQAEVVVGDAVIWMSNSNKFFMYDGNVRQLDCEVLDFVFQDLNRTNAAKVIAVANSAFDEVIWFYPSAGQVENDSYVSYNYHEGHWAVGRMGRSAGIDKGAFDHPIYVSSAGVIYEHELGEMRSGVAAAFAESGPIEMRDVTGDWIAHEITRAQRYIPDEKTFTETDPDSLNDVRLKFFTSFFPTETEVDRGYVSLANPTNLRFSGRQIRMRVEEVNAVKWRFGVPRLGILPAGRR